MKDAEMPDQTDPLAEIIAAHALGSWYPDKGQMQCTCGWIGALGQHPAHVAEAVRAESFLRGEDEPAELDRTRVRVSDEWIAELGKYKAGAEIELPWAGEVSGE